MRFTALVILIALVQYLFFTGQVGLMRGRHGVKAPQTSGHETWERLFRVQQNTMEQLIIFIPAMIAFSLYASPGGVRGQSSVRLYGNRRPRKLLLCPE